MAGITVTAVMSWAPYPKVDIKALAVDPNLLGPVRVERLHANGDVFRVLTGGRNMFSGSWSGVDYHAPFNQSVRYRVTAAGQSSDWSDSVQLVSTRLWVLHPTNPALSMSFAKWRIDPFETTYEPRDEVFDVLNSSRPVVRTWGEQGTERGAVALKVVGVAERDAVKALFQAGGPLLINSPLDEIGWMWVRRGTLKISNPATYTQFPYRWAGFDYRECRQPSGDLKPAWSCDDVSRNYGSCDALADAFATCDYLALRGRPVWTCDDVAAQFATCDAVTATFSTCDGLAQRAVA